MPVLSSITYLFAQPSLYTAIGMVSHFQGAQEVILFDNRGSLYVNHQRINTQQDSSFSSGQIAVVAESENSSTEVMFRNAKVWQL